MQTGSRNTSKIAEGVESEFIGIINYSVIGLIQLENGSGTPMDEEKAIELYSLLSYADFDGMLDC